MLERLRALLEANGRDPATFDIQTNLSTTAASPGEWVAEAKWWRDQGVTYLGLGGFSRDSTPAEALQVALEKRRILVHELG